MPYVKNQAGQVLYFYAFDANGDPATGDAANLSGKISLDGGAWADLTNAISEDAYGWYKVTLSQWETNADQARVRIVSTTAGVKVNPIIIHFTTLTETKTGYLDAAISSRASQDSVNAIPTNPLLANDVRLSYVDAAISSRASQSSVDGIANGLADAADEILTAINAIPTNPLLRNDARLNNLDVAVSTRASQDSVPTENQIIRAMWSRFEYNRETKRFTVYDLSGNPLVTGKIDKTETGSERRPD